MLHNLCISLRYIRRFSIVANSVATSLRCVDSSSSNRSCENRNVCDISSSDRSCGNRSVCDTCSSNRHCENRNVCDTSSSNRSFKNRNDCDTSLSKRSCENRNVCDASSSNGGCDSQINLDVYDGDGESLKSSDSHNLRIDDVNTRIRPRLEEPALIKLKNERDPDRLFRLFMENARNTLVVENKYAFEDTVSRLAGARRYDYIEHLLEHQKSLPQGRREGFVVRIIMLYGRAGMVKKAVDTFYNMHLFRCKRTVKSLNATLKVLAETRDLEAISSFLEEAPSELGVELDLISMNIVVSAFCQMKMLDKAYLVMMEMEKQGNLPDVVTFTTLISASYKCGRWEIGNGLWNLMIYKGCCPNVATFNARIQFLVSRRRAWAANDLLLFMEELGMPPDEVTYNLVIKGFFEAGFIDMARRVYSAMHGRGCKPNLKIYQTMVHYLCKAREFESAYNMCKDCLKKNWIFNLGTICTLLQGLKSRGKVHNAWMIIGLLEQRRPPFSGQQLDDFKSILGRR